MINAFFFPQIKETNQRQSFQSFLKSWRKGASKSHGLTTAFKLHTPPPSYSYTKSIRVVKTKVRHVSTSPLHQSPNPSVFPFLSNHPIVSAFSRYCFSKITSQRVGKALHALCITFTGLFNLSTFQMNTLISFYSRLDDIESARYLFDVMSQRNEVSWNIILSAYVQVGLYQQAFEFFFMNRDVGFRLNGVVLSSLITACDRSGSMRIRGLQLHTVAVKTGWISDVIVGTSLLHFYGACGLVCQSEKLFHEMPHRNVVSWTSLMVGHLDSNEPDEVVNLYGCMRRERVLYNENTCTTVVSACSLLENELIGLQVVGDIVKAGFDCNVSVANSLISMFGSFGNVEEARHIFDCIDEPDIISWNAIVSANANSGLLEDSFIYFRKLRQRHGCFNSTALSTLLTVCGSHDGLRWGEGVHSLALTSGLSFNICFCNTLLNMYCEAGKLEESELVFHEMPEKDLISWNSMIACFAQYGKCLNAMELLVEMLWTRRVIDFVTFKSVLTACSSSEFLIQGKTVHALVITAGLKDNLVVCNALISMYGKFHLMEEAEKVFERLFMPNEVTWNALIDGYAENEECEDAFRIFKLMREVGCDLNYITINNILGACMNSNDLLIYGMPIHACIILTGFESDRFVQNSLISMYGKFNVMKEAEKVFERVLVPNVITGNALIGGYAKNEQCEDAFRIFKLMREVGCDTNCVTIGNILGACLNCNDLLIHGMPTHACIILTGFESDRFLQSSLISMYARCGDHSSSNNIFYAMDYKDHVTWNAMIAASAHHGHPENALKLLVNMRASGLEMDCFSFSGSLDAAANLAVLEDGQQLHALAVKLGFSSDLQVINSMVDMYGKCGDMDDASKVLPHPGNRSLMSWNILISTYARHGCIQKAREAFHEMLKLGLKPDHVTFVSLLSACSHRGLVDEGLRYYGSMEKDFAVSPRLEHCVCIVDLLGRSGRLDEAEAFIERMPMLPNDCVWRSLLAACKVHGNSELGKKASDRLIELDPSDASAYVLYSNVCATSRRWADAENIRRKMGSMKRNPGCSWIKLKDQISSFKMGDKSHPQMKQIYAKLVELMTKIKEAGYVADTSFALHDTDEEQKEQILWNHSERLALAFGLINTPEGSTIRIFMTLRVCGDCHSVYKFVSRIVDRKIILKDPYRFHHFSSGECSCSDYW